MSPLRSLYALAALAAAVGGVGCSEEAGHPAVMGVAGASTAGSGGGPAGAGAGAANAGAGAAAGALAAGGASAGSGGTAAEPGAGASGSSGAGQAGSSANGPITCRAAGDAKSTLTFINHCDEALSVRGSDIEGAELLPGEHACRDVGSATESIPAIRYWGFIGVDPGAEKHTLAELTLNTDFNDFDWYNISHVDAHNLPMSIVPVAREDCRSLTCAESLLEGCPAEGRFAPSAGEVIACVSPQRDDPQSVVAQYFEASCADAYSWSGDDAGSVAACAGEDYDIVFCP